MYACVWRSEVNLSVAPQGLSTSFLLELDTLARLIGQQTLGLHLHLPLPPQHRDYTPPWPIASYVGAGDSNSRPCACRAGTSPAEPPLQS